MKAPSLDDAASSSSSKKLYHLRLLANPAEDFPFFLIDPSPDHVCVTFYGVEIKLLLSQCLSIENIETCFIPFVTDLWVRARLRARKVVHPRCTVVQSNAKGMALLVHT